MFIEGVLSFLFFGAISVAVVFTFILPWVNYGRIKELNQKIDALTAAVNKTGVEALITTQAHAHKAQIAQTTQAIKELASPKKEAKKAVKELAKAAVKMPAVSASFANFDQDFGVRLPVWVGGIALVLAGFYLVKYSIDNNLLSPSLRVILGVVLGGVLLFAADWVRQKPQFSNGVRIAQSLSGAGIAVLYVSFFAATSLYGLIPNYASLVAMGGITVLAIAQSLRHGPPIALMGLVGGFFTPLLIGGETSVPMLLLFVYFVFGALMFVIKRNNWWKLSIPTLLAAFAWCLTILVQGGDAVWLGLFLLAVSGTMVASSKAAYQSNFGLDNNTFKLTSALTYIGLVGSVILMASLVISVDPGSLEWGLFALLAIGSIALAYFDDKLYGFVPWVSMGASMIILFMWHTPDTNMMALILAIFALIYTGAGYGLLWRTNIPLMWASLTGVASMVFYLLAYSKLQDTGWVDSIPFFWSMMAFTFAGLAAYSIIRIRHRYSDHPKKEHLLAVFAVTASAFIAFGLTIELQYEFLPLAFSIEMLGVALTNHYVPIKALRHIALGLALLFVALMMPQIFMFIEHILSTLFASTLVLTEIPPIIKWPVMQQGVPALMALGTGYFLYREKNDDFVTALVITAVGLSAVMLYVLIRHAFYGSADFLSANTSFTAQGVITNILFVYGLLCFAASRYFDWPALSKAGLGLCAIAVFRIVYFDLMVFNVINAIQPFSAKQVVQGWLIANSLLLPYGLPLIWLQLTIKNLLAMGQQRYAQFTGGLMLLLLFVLISLNIRYFFHGHILSAGLTTDVEVYTYSIAWLLLSAGLLFSGVLKQNKPMRCAALIIVVITVCKVFFYDSDSLEGLYRVFTFFGLGLILMALSWFYTRFVFENKELKLGKERQ